MLNILLQQINEGCFLSYPKKILIYTIMSIHLNEYRAFFNVYSEDKAFIRKKTLSLGMIMPSDSHILFTNYCIEIK